MNENEQMQVFADQLYLYMEKKIDSKLSGKVGYFRAKVVSNPGGNKLEVQRPLDDSTMTLPCADSIADAAAGDQVTVFVYGNLSNAVVAGDGGMLHLGSGRNIFVSTRQPTASDGEDGDIWMVYTA